MRTRRRAAASSFSTNGTMSRVRYVTWFTSATVPTGGSIASQAAWMTRALAMPARAAVEAPSGAGPPRSGSRILEDGFNAQLTALGVVKGRPTLFAATSAFLNEARAPGIVRQALARSGAQGAREPATAPSPTQLP